MQTENNKEMRQRALDFISEGKFDSAMKLVYGPVQRREKQQPELVSIYGCCNAIVLGKSKEGISICKKALKAAPNNPNQYFLLGLAYMSADFRTKAIDVFKEGLEHNPNHVLIKRAMSEMGERQNVAIPFLSRNHPINIKLGQKRHDKKIQKDDEKGKPKK